MITRHTYGPNVWVDLEHPDERELSEIAREFSISERVQAELLSPTPTSLVANDTGMTLIILHFPTHGTADGEVKNQEIDIVVGSSFIITVHYELIETLHRLHKVLETQRLISPHETLTTGVLLEVIFAHFYASVRDHLVHITNRLSNIEHDMFNGLERTTVRSISNVSREFLHIEATLLNQEGPLTRFLAAIGERDGNHTPFSERAERILSERAHVARLVMTYRAIAIELRETNAALLESRQNEIMKTLTVVTFIALPLELITFVFGMHALGAPLEQNPNAFWIILTIMLGTGGVLTIFLARKRWLF